MFVDDYRLAPPWWWRKWIWGIRADIWIKNGGISEKLIKAGQATRIDPSWTAWCRNSRLQSQSVSTRSWRYRVPSML